MKFNKTVLVASAAIMSLGLAACDTAAENEAEDDIEQMEENRDEAINNMEDEGVITDDTADAMDDNTDAMEEVNGSKRRRSDRISA